MAESSIKEALLNSDIKNQNEKTLEELKFIADTLIKNLLEVQEDIVKPVELDDIIWYK